MATASMRWWRHITTAGLSVLLVFQLGSARAPVAESEMDAQVQNIVADNLAPVATANDAGGVAAAVYVAGHTMFFNYGLADQAGKRAIASDTLFNVASLRKVFEAALVALGTLRGELSLDDPVNKYVTELQGDYIRRVTIGELATHTSGLLLATDHPPWPVGSYSLAEFINTLNAWTPHAGEEPGRQRIYTQAGYVLLQLALERRYRLPISELIESRILRPLGMNSTRLPERGPDHRAIMSPALMPYVVQGYTDTACRSVRRATSRAIMISPGPGRFSPRRGISLFSSPPASMVERPIRSCAKHYG